MKKIPLKFISLILFAGFGWTGLLTANQAEAHFDDIENSENNTYQMGTLDFSLSSDDDFSSAIASANSTASRNIKISNNSTLPLKYQIKTGNISGSLCDRLTLKIELNGIEKEKYNSSIIEGKALLSEPLPILNKGQENNWTFTVTFGEFDPQGETCNFDLVFEGWQEDITNYGDGGFSDEEIINNTILSKKYVTPGEENSKPTETSGPAEHLVINEVQVVGANANDEFVELYNPTNAEIDISGWKLQYKKAISGDWTNRTGSNGLPSNSKIDPYSFFLLASKSYDGSITPDYRHSANWRLKNSAGHVRIIDNSASEIDKVGYGSTADLAEALHSVLNPPANQSIERGLTGYDNDDNSKDFIIKNNPTPTNSNGDGMSDIVINEFLASGEKFKDFVELYNNSSFDTLLTGWKIEIESDDGVNLSTSLNGKSILTKKWLAIDYDNGNVLQASSTITLYNATSDVDVEADKISYHDATEADKSYARISDGSPNWVDPVPTPGKPNKLAENGDLEIAKSPAVKPPVQVQKPLVAEPKEKDTGDDKTEIITIKEKEVKINLTKELKLPENFESKIIQKIKKVEIQGEEKTVETISELEIDLSQIKVEEEKFPAVIKIKIEELDLPEGIEIISHKNNQTIAEIEITEEIITEEIEIEIEIEIKGELNLADGLKIKKDSFEQKIKKIKLKGLVSKLKKFGDEIIINLNKLDKIKEAEEFKFKIEDLDLPENLEVAGYAAKESIFEVEIEKEDEKEKKPKQKESPQPLEKSGSEESLDTPIIKPEEDGGEEVAETTDEDFGGVSDGDGDLDGGLI